MDDKPKPKFFRVGTSIMDEGVLPRMSGVDLKVYTVLSRHANWYTGKCWPSYETIQRLSGSSSTSISAAIRQLVRLGAISCRQEKTMNGLRNVYTVFRTLQASSGTHSRTTEFPPAPKKRDKLGRFLSRRAEDPRSNAAEDPHSSHTDQNEIYLNQINGIRSKESPPRPQRGSDSEPAASESVPPRTSIQDEIIKKLIGEKGSKWVINYMREHGYPIPAWLHESAQSKQEGQ